jgi:ubiquinone/menaquinone biosynthesis C-methylase UbiE
MYAWFYRHQRRGYVQAVDRITVDHPKGSTLLDVGCGTGALSSLLSTHFTVSAVDGASRMIDHAKRLHTGEPIAFTVGDVLHGLPFPDRHFEVVIASFVLHGLPPAERLIVLEELSRLAKAEVVILDYSTGRHPLIDAVERMENGHYFSFIATFTDTLKARYPSFTITPLTSTSALYRIPQKTS